MLNVVQASGSSDTHCNQLWEGLVCVCHHHESDAECGMYRIFVTGLPNTALNVAQSPPHSSQALPLSEG